MGPREFSAMLDKLASSFHKGLVTEYEYLIEVRRLAHQFKAVIDGE